VGTGYSIHISRSRSVKAISTRSRHEPNFREYVVRRAVKLEPR
jgi:hypothetical protein